MKRAMLKCYTNLFSKRYNRIRKNRLVNADMLCVHLLQKDVTESSLVLTHRRMIIGEFHMTLNNQL